MSKEPSTPCKYHSCHCSTHSPVSKLPTVHLHTGFQLQPATEEQPTWHYKRWNSQSHSSARGKQPNNIQVWPHTNLVLPGTQWLHCSQLITALAALNTSSSETAEEEDTQSSSQAPFSESHLFSWSCISTYIPHCHNPMKSITYLTITEDSHQFQQVLRHRQHVMPTVSGFHFLFSMFCILSLLQSDRKFPPAKQMQLVTITTVSRTS